MFGVMVPDRALAVEYTISWLTLIGNLWSARHAHQGNSYIYIVLMHMWQQDAAVDSKVPIYTLALPDLDDESMSLLADNG